MSDRQYGHRTLQLHRHGCILHWSWHECLLAAQSADIVLVKDQQLAVCHDVNLLMLYMYSASSRTRISVLTG